MKQKQLFKEPDEIRSRKDERLEAQKKMAQEIGTDEDKDIIENEKQRDRQNDDEK